MEKYYLLQMDWPVPPNPHYRWAGQFAVIEQYYLLKMGWPVLSNGKILPITDGLASSP
jgi:hypothetical protein